VGTTTLDVTVPTDTCQVQYKKASETMLKEKVTLGILDILTIGFSYWVRRQKQKRIEEIQEQIDKDKARKELLFKTRNPLDVEVKTNEKS
jgi:hypothetical protein